MYLNVKMTVEHRLTHILVNQSPESCQPLIRHKEKLVKLWISKKGQNYYHGFFALANVDRLVRI